MPQFGVRLSDEQPDLDQVVRVTGRSADAVQRDFAQGFVARDLTRALAEQLVADLGAAGLAAEIFTPPLQPLTLSSGGLGSLGGFANGPLGSPRMSEKPLGQGLPGLGLGRRATQTILGPPVPAEPATGRVDAVPPPGDLPPVALPPPTSDAELLPSLKVDDPAALPPPQILSVSAPPPTSSSPRRFEPADRPDDRRETPRSSTPPAAAPPGPSAPEVTPGRTPRSASITLASRPSAKPKAFWAAPQQPASQQPASQRPASQQPAPQQPASQQPASQQPASQQPAPREARSLPVAPLPTPRTSTPMPLTAASAALIAPPNRSNGALWIVAATLVVLSGVLIAWAWSARDAAINALRRAEIAYAKGDYVQAAAAAERARAHGADIWADRLQAAIAAGPHVDLAEAKLAADDLVAAQASLDAALTKAPKDTRALQVALEVMQRRAARARRGSLTAVASAAPRSAAPATQIAVAPTSIAPASIAPASIAPASVAPTSVAPTSVAPASAAPLAPASAIMPPSAAPPAPSTAATPPSVASAGSDAPPEVRFARPPSQPTRDRSKVARLKIISDLVGEIVVDGQRVSVAVPGWIEVPPGRRKLAIRGVDGEVRALRAVRVQAGRRATVRLSAE